MKHYILVLSILVLPLGIFAQDTTTTPPISTDRPGASNGSSLVSRGLLQYEVGGSYTSFEEMGLRSQTYEYHNSLFRYGVLENVELRLAFNFQEVWFSQNEQDLDTIRSGFSPLALGAKIKIIDEKGAIPKVTFIGNVVLPFTASSDYKPETTTANFVFAMTNTLSEKSSLTYNLGAQWGGDTSEAVYVYTLNYGYSISKALGLFAELYGNFPENSKSNHLWDAGIVYLVSNNVQLDLSAGTSITTGQDIFAALGASIRLPV